MDAFSDEPIVHDHDDDDDTVAIVKVRRSLVGAGGVGRSTSLIRVCGILLLVVAILAVTTTMIVAKEPQPMVVPEGDSMTTTTGVSQKEKKVKVGDDGNSTNNNNNNKEKMKKVETNFTGNDGGDDIVMEELIMDDDDDVNDENEDRDTPMDGVGSPTMEEDKQTEEGEGKEDEQAEDEKVGEDPQEPDGDNNQTGDDDGEENSQHEKHNGGDEQHNNQDQDKNKSENKHADEDNKDTSPPSATKNVTIPDIESLVDLKNRKIISNVSWLLDFAVIGFPKCGTTSMKQWLSQAPQLYSVDHEVAALSRNDPVGLIEELYNQPELLETRPFRGIKFPSDIDSKFALKLYQQYFPNTKFVVQLRHPLLWFQSYYNFRIWKIYNQNLDITYPHPNDLIGSCLSNGEPYSCLSARREYCKADNVCTDRAKFHHAISRLGLTPMTDPEELNLLQHHNMTIHPTNQQVFLLEMDQWKDPLGERYAEALRTDLGNFLGIGGPLPPRKNYKHRETWVEGLSIRICEPEHDEVRKLLLDIANDVADWILKYLLKSPQVVVSSRKHFRELIRKYKEDPCKIEDGNDDDVGEEESERRE